MSVVRTSVGAVSNADDAGSPPPRPGDGPIEMPGTTGGRCPRCERADALRIPVYGVVIPPVPMTYEEHRSDLAEQRHVLLGCSIETASIPAYWCASCQSAFDTAGEHLPSALDRWRPRGHES